MMILLNIFLIVSISVLIIDISGFSETYKKIIAYILKIKDYAKVKGLCSLCIGWWCSLLYLIITGNLTIFNIFYCLLIACFSQQICGIIRLLQDTIIKIIDLIYEKLLK